MTAVTLILTFYVFAHRESLPIHQIIDELCCVSVAAKMPAPQAGIKGEGIDINVPAITVPHKPCRMCGDKYGVVVVVVVLCGGTQLGQTTKPQSCESM